MSIVDNFMSQVIDLNETEKEQTILFLAEALVNDNFEFLKHISPKVQNIVMPFLTSIAIRGNLVRRKIIKKGGEKVGSIGTGKITKKNKRQ